MNQEPEYTDLKQKNIHNLQDAHDSLISVS
jgi:hypothetical protein